MGAGPDCKSGVCDSRGSTPRRPTMMATAYAKDAGGAAAVVQALAGGLASPGEPLRGRPDSFEPVDVLEAGRLQAAFLNRSSGRRVAGGRLITALVQRCHVDLHDLRSI